jgi:outer membrane murein-binding lipoprotein Lpp
MGKKVVLLAVVCLLTVMAGCSSYGKTNTPTPAPVTSQNQQIATSQTNTTITPAPQKQASTPVPTVTQQTYSSTAENWPYSSLVLPNGKVITSKDNQPSYWKGLNIQLYTALGANDNLLSLVEEIVGNHTYIVSQDLQPVTLTIGPAILVMVDRTPPAASGSNTVTHECWLIAFRPDPNNADRQFTYAIQAILVNVSPSDASSELLELSKGWKLPAFQTQGPGK